MVKFKITINIQGEVLTSIVSIPIELFNTNTISKLISYKLKDRVLSEEDLKEIEWTLEFL